MKLFHRLADLEASGTILPVPAAVDARGSGDDVAWLTWP